MNNTYTRAYTEVLEILNHFSKEEYDKIPTEKIEFYQNNMDKEYDYRINPKVDLSKQNISKEANAILISLFRDYFATEKQKSILENLLNQNQLKEEEEKVEKYNSDNIFKDKLDMLKATTEENVSITKYKESLFSKFFNKLKTIFNK